MTDPEPASALLPLLTDLAARVDALNEDAREEAVAAAEVR